MHYIKALKTKPHLDAASICFLDFTFTKREKISTLTSSSFLAFIRYIKPQAAVASSLQVAPVECLLLLECSTS